MIKIDNLVKTYGKKTVVNSISFEVKKGEVVGFLGPNGAGKTTTMNILTGYISSDSGKVTVDGYDILENPDEVKKRIGYLPELPPLYFEMTVNEYLEFVFDLKKAHENVKDSKKEHIDKILKAIHIDHVSGRLIKNLSKGYKQRVGIAQALIGNPEVLILDEPTVGLDPKQIIEIRNLIGELKSEHTIILSSHVLPEVSAICERVIIINEGNIVAEDTPEELSKKFIGNRYTLSITGRTSELEAVLNTASYISEFDVLNTLENVSEYSVVFNGDSVAAREKLFVDISSYDIKIIGLRPADMTLEEIFVKLTEKSKREDV